MDTHAKIYVAGHRGMVGAAIIRRLQQDGYTNILTRTSEELDLRDQKAVNAFFEAHAPEYVFLAAAKVGGILANSRAKAEFFYHNMMIELNVIHSGWKHGVKKLCFLGSSCIYPKDALQPIKETYLMAGPLEPTNDAYALAKIAGIQMCRAYEEQYGFQSVQLMPCNLYGPGDNFDLASAHVLPALVRKVVEAKRQGIDHIELWGSGTPRREFLYVVDVADAAVFFMHQDVTGLINIGTGEDITIHELAELISDIAGHKVAFTYDSSKPDGVARKLLDVSKAADLGWRYTTPLREGIGKTIDWYREHIG